MEDRTRINFVVTGFENLEKQLAECMEFLPFIEENKKAISPNGEERGDSWELRSCHS